MDEALCPYCGLRNPGSGWNRVTLNMGVMSGGHLIRNIIYLNAAMFILSIVLHPSSAGFSMNPFEFFSPGSQILLLLGATGRIPIDGLHRWWTIISANYLHGSILHILFNMMALSQIGPLIIQEFGVYRTVTIYTLSGVGGYVVSYLAGVPLTLGASAAVCGLIGAALFFGKSRGGHFGQMVYQQVGGWAIGIFIFGFLFGGINNWAHGGGLVFGILIAFLFGYLERTPENQFDKTAALICIIATLGTLVLAVGSTLLRIA